MIKEGILAAYLLWMAAVDAKTKTVPVWPGIAGILLFSVMGVVKGQGILSLLGGIVIGAFCFTVSVLSRQAVGAGDVIVLGVTGAALGFFDNLEILMLALFFCSVTGVILMAVKKKGKTYRLAFVPFISAAFAAIEIVKWKG